MVCGVKRKPGAPNWVQYRNNLFKTKPIGYSHSIGEKRACKARMSVVSMGSLWNPELYPEEHPRGLQQVNRQGNVQDHPGSCLAACAPAWNALRGVREPEVMCGHVRWLVSKDFTFSSDLIGYWRCLPFIGLFRTEANSMWQHLCLAIGFKGPETYHITRKHINYYNTLIK